MRQTVTVLVVAVLAFGVVAPVASADAARTHQSIQQEADGPTVRSLQLENLTTTFTVDSMELGRATLGGTTFENVSLSDAEVSVTNATVSVSNASLTSDGALDVENGTVSVDGATVTVAEATGTVDGQQVTVEDRTFTVGERTIDLAEETVVADVLGQMLRSATISEMTVTGLSGNLSVDRAQLTQLRVGDNTANVTAQDGEAQFEDATLSVENATVEDGAIRGEDVTLTVDDGYVAADFAFFMVDRSFIGFENERVGLEDTTIVVEDGTLTLRTVKDLIP